ncbi:uncharacterized protein [Spinacia oleracea]|uniref:KIB1-4 beta-propeller domain-containing protein n=1 Tax=Spinacia oleracea TaxID=3562 RepID=A0ABM3RQ47_SPIOL|nr:uncharacterized protein LOC110792224 [Spinacia oleracea]
MKNPRITTKISPDHHHPNTPAPQWTDLPKDFLFRIIPFLDSKTDLNRIRAVCPSWRAALPLAELPVHKPYIQVPSLGDGNNHPLFLLETTFYYLSPLSSPSSSSGCGGGGWVARMGEIGTKKWKLLNPLSYSQEHEHHYFYTEPTVTGEINLLDIRVFELSRPMSLVHKLDYSAEPISMKVVGGWDFTSTYPFVVLVLLEPQFEQKIRNEQHGGLILWRLGEQEWLRIEGSQEINTGTIRHIIDIGFHKGKFYVFEAGSADGAELWRVRVINPRNSLISEEFISGPDIWAPNNILLPGVSRGFPLWSLDMVPSKSKGCLYLVIVGLADKDDRDKDGNLIKKMCVLLMKEQEESSQWELVENLGDEILFVGYNVSFSLPSSAGNLPQWKPNSICTFTTRVSLNGYEVYRSEGRGPQMPKGTECLQFLNYPSYNRFFSLFDMEERDKGGVFFHHMSEEDQELYTGLFFPPPDWVKWRCPSLNNIEVKLHGLRFRDRNHDHYNYDDDDDDEEEEED